MASSTDGTIRLLHLSDLHARGDTKWDSARVTHQLVKDVKRLAARKLRPDFVLFTGDLAWAGQPEEFALGWQVLADVQTAVGLPDDAVFLVPGNHDVDRSAVNRLAKRWRTKTDRDEVDEILREGGEEWDDLTRRLAGYRGFLEARKLDHLRADFPSRAIWHARRTIGEKTIGLAGFNTAWTCGEDDENGRLWMGARWQRETLFGAVEDADVRIALLHHPPSWLHEHEKTGLRVSLQRDFHLVLHGHEHHDEPEVDHRGHAWLSAGACYDRSDRKNGYSLIELDPTIGQLRVHLWRYGAEQGTWVGRPLADDGESTVRIYDASSWLGGGAAAARSATPKTAARRLDAAHRTLCDDFVAHQRRKNATLPLTGFPSDTHIPLDLDAVYVPLRAWQRAPRLMRDPDAPGARKEIDAELKEALTEGEEVPFDQAFRKAQASDLRGAVVLGDPGSGKTTLLKHFLLVDDPSTLGLPGDAIPILVLLRSLPDPGAGLRPAIAHALQQTCTHLDAADAESLAKALLRRGRLLLLFDGLDEVANADDRAAIAAWLEAEIAAYSSCFFVMTSRYAGYRADARLSSRFLELHVRPLTVDEAKRFIGNWYGAVVDSFGREPDGSPATHDDAARRAEALGARIFDVPAARVTNLQELATNPLMLQILCLLFWKQGHLPEKRAELYEACVRTLLALWRSAKRLRPADDAPSIGYVDALAVLRPLAWRLQQAGVRELPEAEVIEAIRGPLRMRRGVNLSPEQFLDHARAVTGVLVLLGRGDYGFLHLSFQEYLAACHVQDRFSKEPGVLDALAGNFGESWWREVILLSLGLTGPSVFDEVMTHLVGHQALSRDPLLASDCLRDAAEPSARPLLDALDRGIDDADERFQVLRLLKSDALRDWADAALLERLCAQEEDVEVLGLLHELLGTELLGRETPPETAEAGAKWRNPADGSVLVHVPGGSYTLGGEAYGDEKPIHTVTLSPYWIGKYPVTNAQYGRFLKATSYEKPQYWDDARLNGPDQPVVGMSWHDAQAYCAWAGLSLPSEAQWEAAARGTKQREFPWGNKDPAKNEKLANFGQNVGRTTPVGSYPAGAGPFGALDQAGNVWEWCVDLEDASAYAQREGEIDPVRQEENVSKSADRVLRGGSWAFGAENLRAACRIGYPGGIRFRSIGFRVCRSVPRARLND